MSLLDEVALKQAGIKTSVDYLNIEKVPTPIAPAPKKQPSILDQIAYQQNPLLAKQGDGSLLLPAPNTGKVEAMSAIDVLGAQTKGVYDSVKNFISNSVTKYQEGKTAEIILGAKNTSPKLFQGNLSPVDKSYLQYMTNKYELKDDQKQVVGNYMASSGDKAPSGVTIAKVLKDSGVYKPNNISLRASGALSDIISISKDGLKKLYELDSPTDDEWKQFQLHFDTNGKEPIMKDPIAATGKRMGNGFVGLLELGVPISYSNPISAGITTAFMTAAQDHDNAFINDTSDMAYNLGTNIVKIPGFSAIDKSYGDDEGGRQQFRTMLGFGVIGIGTHAAFKEIPKDIDLVPLYNMSQSFKNAPLGGADKSLWRTAVQEFHPDKPGGSADFFTRLQDITALREKGAITSNEFKASVNKLRLDKAKQGITETKSKPAETVQPQQEKSISDAIDTATDMKSPVVVQKTTDGHSVLEGNARANIAINRGSTIHVYVPATTIIPGEIILEDNVPRSQVIQDNTPTNRKGGVEDSARLNDITKSFIQGETTPIENWKMVEVPASSLDVKSVPKGNLNLDAMKVPTRSETTGVITTKQSNALNQKVKTDTIDNFVGSTAKILTDKGYTVELDKSTMKKDGFGSQYIFVTKGDKSVTMRVSNHELKDVYVDKYGMPGISIDINGKTKVPFDKISSRLAGENIAPQKQDFSASARLKQFNEIKNTLSDPQVVQFAGGSNKDQALNAAIEEETRVRGIEDKITELMDKPAEAIPLPATAKKTSIMDQVQEREMSGATDAELKKRQFGFTYDPQGGALYEAGGKTDGIVVTPFPNRSGFIPGEMDRINFGVEFEKYVQKNMDLIQQGLKAGGWYSDKRQGLVFDVGIVLPTEFRVFAEKLGKDTNQEGIFNLFDTNEDTAYIPTGGDGTVPQGFDEKAILDIIRPYISKQPSYDTIPTNGIRGPIKDEQGANSGSVNADVGQDNGGPKIIALVKGEAATIKASGEKYSADAPTEVAPTDALPATLFDHPTEEIIPLPDPFADQPYDITKYNYNTSKIEKKSGYRFTGKNLAITAGIVGGLAAATAAPIIGAGFAVTTALGLSPGGLIAVGGILFPNTFSSIFYKSKILNAFRDENGVPVSQLMTNEDAYNLSRVQAVVKQYGMDTALENLANDKEYIDKLYDILWDGIDDILAKETHNLENGHRLSAQDKQAIKHIFPASLGNFRFNALHLNYDALLALKKMMAMKNLYDYYPQDIAKIIRENTPEIIDLFEKSDIKGNTDRGYRELGQNQVDAGLLPEYNVVEGYERFLVLSETYKYDMNKGEDISHGYANMEEYLAAKELEYSLADKETQNAMESELSRLRTSIQKAKGDASVDVFRVHYDLAQFLDYIIQYSETITRKQKMDILTKVNELDPISVGTKKLHADKIFVSLIDDLFFPNKLTLPSLIEMKRANKLYGAENNAAKSIAARNLSNNMIAGLAVDVVSGSFKGAYWLIGGGAQLLQGIYSIAFVNMPGLLKSGYRLATVGGFYNTKNVGKFFIENRLSARHTTGNMVLQHMTDEIKMRNEYSRFGINAIYRTAGNVGTALDSSSQFLFGGPVETWVSEHIILNEIYAYMDKKGGQYSIVQKGKQAGVNAQKLIEDFNNLPEGEKGILLARLREISQSLYDGITRSASGIAILRIPYMKFFNRFISSFSVQQINKLADVKSLINDTISSKSFKDAYHTFNSDKNQFYRTAGKNILGYALTAGLILKIMIEKNTEDCKDDECRKAKTLESTTMFTRALGVKLENAVLSSLRSIIGTPAGYYDKLMFSVDDIVQGMWTGNDSQRDVGINGLVSNLGGIKNVVTMPIFGGMFMGTTAWLNATNLTNTNWGDWFAHNFTRLYATDREKMNIIDQVAKNPNADMDGFWWLNNQATIISNQEYTNTQHGFARIMMGISEKGAELFFGLPFINLLGVGGEGTVTDTKDLMDQRNAKLEAFENVKTIETTIENTDKTNLNDIIYDAALALGVDKNPQDIHFVSQLSKSFGGLRKNNVDLLRAMDNNSQTGGIVVTNSDVSDGKTFLAKLRANPMLYAQFVKGVKAIASNPKDYDSEDKLKKLFSGGIKSTDPLLDALSFYNKSPVYSNNGADFLLKSVGKEGITGSEEEVTQKLSTIEAYLRVSSVSELTSDASLRGIQIAFGDKYETSIIDLKKRGLFSAHDYPNIAESMIALVGARSLSKFDAKDMQPQIDMIKAGGAESINEVVKPTEEYTHGVIMSTEGSAWNHGVAIVNEKESPLYAPISGVVLESSYIQGLGNQIKIQDINGNVIQYSNLSGYNVAPGQFIKAGMQVGKGEVIQSTLYSPENVIASPDKTEEYIKTDITPVKKATPTISAPPAAERNTMPVVPNEGLRHSSADQDWSLGDTPLNEIVKRELDAIMKSENVKKIDFSKLSAKINGKGTKKKKTSPKKSLSIMEEVISLQPKKSNLSIMQEIISKQTTK